MTFQTRPAVRDGSRLLIGLAGPTGSGKTYSALLIAKGLGGTIVVIDTERGRAKQYATNDGDDLGFDFLHMEFDPPFSPARYIEALNAALKDKPATIIIDSGSHLWEGDGGVKDAALAAQEAAKAKGWAGAEFSSWAKPKEAHRQFVNALISMPCHVIVCFRAKEKKQLVKNARGRNEVVNTGWHPICEAGLPYEMTILALLNPERGKGVPVINGFDLGKLPITMQGLMPEEPITVATGERLAEWAGSGTASSAANQETKHTAKPRREPTVDASLFDAAPVNLAPSKLDDGSFDWLQWYTDARFIIDGAPSQVWLMAWSEENKATLASLSGVKRSWAMDLAGRIAELAPDAEFGDGP